MAAGTPLASLLPSKYKDCDVTKLFPGFQHNKVLRFSRLFGPAKHSNLPIINETSETNNKLVIRAANPDEYPNESPSAPASPDRSNAKEDEAAKKAKEEELNCFDDWRFGPARYWFDSIDAPTDRNAPFDYGFKSKTDSAPDLICQETRDPDDSFHMVSQLLWEDDVIWDSQEGNRIISKITKKCQAAGWVPSALHRRASDFNHQVREPRPQNIVMPPVHAKTVGRGRSEKNKQVVEESDITWYSIFPVENDDLIYKKWEEDVIWDAENMPKVPKPKILTLDPNDENIVLKIPEEKVKTQEQMQAHNRKTLSQLSSKEKRELAKKAKLKYGKSKLTFGSENTIATQDEIVVNNKPWNISNDEYYTYRQTPDVALKPNVGNFLQHSTPAVELRQPFFPTYMNPNRLRQFHRPPLKRYSHGALAEPVHHTVESLVKHIKKKEKQREQERLASGGGEMFFMHTAEDLSGKDGELILAECSEEYPPLLNQVGMATRIKNYMRRKASCSLEQQERELSEKYEYGDPTIFTSTPFLGNLPPGESLQTIENNMYRAPIYEHNLPSTDFLVVRTREKYFIREVSTIFTVGQELPIIEVPGPNSKKANNFIRDFLQVYIYRLFWKSTDKPRRIRMEDIKKAFPLHSESSIRKRLKQCADFKRTGMDSNWWVLKNPSDFRLPPEAEIRTIVTPEQCCAYYSMLSAEQRLKDAGYGEKSLFAPEDEDDEELQLKIEDEVKAAPWNTSRAFISAMKHKCLLQLTGVADPTGCHEGFSYVRVPNKPLLSKEESVKEPQPKKTVTGTDADLRRLKLETAKDMLKAYGVPQETIKSLPRWDIISKVRDLSTRQVRTGEDASSNISKFARGNRFSIAEHQEKYKDACQRIFNVQNQVLASDEILSSAEEASSDDNSDIEEMGKNLASMIANGTSSSDMSFQREEAERKELYKLVHDDNSISESNKAKKIKLDSDEASNQDALPPPLQPPTQDTVKVLKIYRTFRDPHGAEVVRVETVTKPVVVENYIRIRKTKNSEEIKLYAASGEDSQRDFKKKERKPPGRKKKIVVDEQQPKTTFIEEGQISMEPEIIKTEDMKIRINTRQLNKLEETKKRALRIKIPLDAIKKRRSTNQDNLDYLEKPTYNTTSRMRSLKKNQECDM